MQSLSTNAPGADEDDKGQGIGLWVAKGQYEFDGHGDDTPFMQRIPAAHLVHVPIVQFPGFEEP